MSTKQRRARIALVLAGGAARGAYEVGVLQHVLQDVARDLGREVPIDIFCGTSVGAINACALAAFADEPRARADRMAEVWGSLRVEDVIHPELGELFVRMMRMVVARPGAAPVAALLEPAGLQRLVAERIPFHRIGEHLAAGRLQAVTVSTTHVATGRTVVFIQQRDEDPIPAWSSDPTVIPRETELRPEHAWASAAIPFLFPPVRIGDELHCDGGLRQNVPLSPARRLGADAILVVSPRHGIVDPQPGAEEKAGGLLSVLGQTLNAFMLDRIESDLDRLRRINLILEAGDQVYGDRFVDTLNEELGFGASLRIRRLSSLLIRSSVDLGRVAAEYVRSPEFKGRASGVVGRLVRRMANAEGAGHSDLLSYLLFDGEYARRLMELGRADARARHDDLCRFFDAQLS